MKKILMMIPAYKKHHEKKEMEKAKADFLEEKRKALRDIKGKVCYLKLMERLGNRETVRKAREKRERRCSKYRAKRERSILGIIIDKDAFTDYEIHELKMGSGGIIPEFVFIPNQKTEAPSV